MDIDPHPDPHADLPRRSPLIYLTQQEWFRLCPIYREPLYFGRSGHNRFDSPDGSYGVLYLGADEHCAFIETFGRSLGTNTVTEHALRDRQLVKVTSVRPITLINIADSGGLARIGADGRLCTGDRRVAQRWSKALRAHPCRPDGIYYPARHDLDRRACALFEDAGDSIRASSLGSLVDTALQSVLGGILDDYSFALVS